MVALGDDAEMVLGDDDNKEMLRNFEEMDVGMLDVAGIEECTDLM